MTLNDTLLEADDTMDPADPTGTPFADDDDMDPLVDIDDPASNPLGIPTKPFKPAPAEDDGLDDDDDDDDFDDSDTEL